MQFHITLKNVDGRNVVLSIRKPNLKNVLHDLIMRLKWGCVQRERNCLPSRAQRLTTVLCCWCPWNVLISLAFCMLCFVLCFVCIRFVSSACVHSRYPTTIAATHLNNVWNQNYDSVQRRKHCIKRAKYMNVKEGSY